jgi:heme oxygenase (biliverdin-producing, ferredoxin)
MRTSHQGEAFVTNKQLSDLVRERTRVAHEQAESRPFIVNLMNGTLDVRSYVDFLGALSPIYEAMEAELRAQSGDASIRMLDDRRLDRHNRMTADLASFGQLGERRHPLAATQAYVEAIKAAAVAPERLLAHHYTRYLGDMAGGRAIARTLHTNYGVPSEQLSFYDFSDLGDLVPYRRRYKEQMDSLPWTDEQRQAFIDEALLAFELNADLFDELGGPAIHECQVTDPEHFLRAERVHLPR